MKTKAWNQDISINCPGVGKGKIINFKKIEKLLKEELENEEDILKNRVSHQK